MDGSVVQPEVRWNARIALGSQSIAPCPEICAAYACLLEPHTDGFELEVAAPDTIEPGARAGLHLMGMWLTFGCPGLRQWWIFSKTAFITEQHTDKARCFLRQMHFNVFAGLLKPLGVSLFFKLYRVL